MPRPSDETIRKTLVPRLKELQAAGCRVFVEFDDLTYQVDLDESDKPYAHHRFFPEHRTYINRYFFDKMYSPIRKSEREGFVPEYTLEDALGILWVEITVQNYKEKITALTKNS